MCVIWLAFAFSILLWNFAVTRTIPLCISVGLPVTADRGSTGKIIYILHVHRKQHINKTESPQTPTVCVYLVCFCDMWLMIVSLVWLVCAQQSSFSRYFVRFLSFFCLFLHFVFVNQKTSQQSECIIIFSNAFAVQHIHTLNQGGCGISILAS